MESLITATEEKNLAEKTGKPANGWANQKAAPLLYLRDNREREREQKGKTSTNYI